MKTFFKLLTISALLAALFPLIPMTYTIKVTEFNLSATMLDKYHLAILDLADDNDTVVIKIDSFGGSAVGALRIINAVRSSEAHTISHNQSSAFSAGALLAISTDEMRANEYSSYMFHKPYIAGPNGEKQIVDDNQVIAISVKKIMKERGMKYLTEKEIELYLEGEDVVIDGQEFIGRVNK